MILGNALCLESCFILMYYITDLFSLINYQIREALLTYVENLPHEQKPM